MRGHHRGLSSLLTGKLGGDAGGDGGGGGGSGDVGAEAPQGIIIITDR